MNDYTTKKNIDNTVPYGRIDNRIIKDIAITALSTWMIVNGAIKIFSPSEKEIVDKYEKNDGFDISRFIEKTTHSIEGFVDNTAHSIEDFVEGIFSKSNDATIQKGYNGPVYPTRTYSKSDIENIIGADLYSRLPISSTKKGFVYNETILDNLEKTFPVIYETYMSLPMPKAVTLELYLSLSRGESAFVSNAVSNTYVRGLFQVTHGTFVRFLPQYRYLYEGPGRNIEKLKELEEDPSLSAYAAALYLIYIDNFLTKNDPTYRRQSIREQQRKIVAAYNAGEGNLQNADYDVGSIKNGKYPFGTDSRALSSYVLGLVYGDESFFIKYYKIGADKNTFKIRSKKYLSRRNTHPARRKE